MLKVKEMSLKYSQDADSCDPDKDGVQVLSIEIVDAGGGPYAVIETNRWAVNPDDIDSLAAELKRLIAEVEKANADA